LAIKNFEDIDPVRDVLELYLGKVKSLIHLMETEAACALYTKMKEERM
jgi:hypothetical protein